MNETTGEHSAAWPQPNSSPSRFLRVLRAFAVKVQPRIHREAAKSAKTSRRKILSCHMVLSFAFILLVSLSGLPQSQVSDSVYDRAAAAFQTGKMAEAEETLRSILRSSPGDVRALGMLGVVLDAQKRFDEAERCYTQALRLA